MNDDQETRKAFAAIMAGLAENASAQVSREGLALRFMALQEFTLEQIQAAAVRILRTRVFTTMPTVADIRAAILGNPEDRAAIEAGKVYRAIGQVGAYRSVCFDDGVTMAVIREIFGGWVRLCGECQDKGRVWFAKEFEAAYSNFSRMGKTDGGKLIGITESENQACGRLGFIRPPVLIGDPVKAAAVLEAGPLSDMIPHRAKLLIDHVAGKV